MHNMPDDVLMHSRDPRSPFYEGDKAICENCGHTYDLEETDICLLCYRPDEEE